MGGARQAASANLLRNLLHETGRYPNAIAPHEIARVSVESKRPLVFIDYATADPFASGLFETALTIEDIKSGICRKPTTFRN